MGWASKIFPCWRWFFLVSSMAYGVMVPVAFLWTSLRSKFGDGARRPVSRVLSAPPTVSHGDAGRPFLLDAPFSAPRATNPDGGAGMLLRLADAAVPIRSCSRWGLPCRPCCQGRGALLPHRFALARGPRRRDLHGRFVFCGTFPGVAPAGRYPAPYSRGARTFLCPLRNSSRPAVWQSIIGR